MVQQVGCPMASLLGHCARGHVGRFALEPPDSLPSYAGTAKYPLSIVRQPRRTPHEGFHLFLADSCRMNKVGAGDLVPCPGGGISATNPSIGPKEDTDRSPIRRTWIQGHCEAMSNRLDAARPRGRERTRQGGSTALPPETLPPERLRAASTV